MKKYLKILLIFSIALLFTACTPKMERYDIFDYENYKISMINDVQKSVIIVHTDNGHGSGIIYAKEPGVGKYKYRYFVLTNAHVVEDSEEISIKYGGTNIQIPVSSYALSSLYDVAVLRVDTNEELIYHDIPAITKNEEVIIKKGQTVFAIGTPHDYKNYNYVTDGIVSLSSYPYNGVENLAIMHNAEVNPGNSGGPLFNLKGEVIGINVAKIPTVSSKDGEIAAEGLNYAININMAAERIRGFKEESFIKIVRAPKLGITVRNLSDQRNKEVNPDYNPDDYPDIDYGVVIIDFDYTRNGHKVFLVKDVIIAMDGKKVSEIVDLQQMLIGAEMGDKHVVTVLRKVAGEFVEVNLLVELS